MSRIQLLLRDRPYRIGRQVCRANRRVLTVTPFDPLPALCDRDYIRPRSNPSLGKCDRDGRNVSLQRGDVTPVSRPHELQFILLDCLFQELKVAAEHDDLSHGNGEGQLFRRRIHIPFQRRIGSKLGEEELPTEQMITVFVVSEHVNLGYSRIGAKAWVVARVRCECCDQIWIGVHKMYCGFVRFAGEENELGQCVGGSVSGSVDRAAKSAEQSSFGQNAELPRRRPAVHWNEQRVNAIVPRHL